VGVFPGHLDIYKSGVTDRHPAPDVIIEFASPLATEPMAPNYG
jgi:hypothetical protein